MTTSSSSSFFPLRKDEFSLVLRYCSLSDLAALRASSAKIKSFVEKYEINSRYQRILSELSKSPQNTQARGGSYDWWKCASLQIIDHVSPREESLDGLLQHVVSKNPSPTPFDKQETLALLRHNLVEDSDGATSFVEQVEDHPAGMAEWKWDVGLIRSRNVALQQVCQNPFDLKLWGEEENVTVDILSQYDYESYSSFITDDISAFREYLIPLLMNCRKDSTCYSMDSYCFETIAVLNDEPSGCSGFCQTLTFQTTDNATIQFQYKYDKSWV